MDTHAGRAQPGLRAGKERPGISRWERLLRADETPRGSVRRKQTGSEVEIPGNRPRLCRCPAVAARLPPRHRRRVRKASLSQGQSGAADMHGPGTSSRAARGREIARTQMPPAGGAPCFGQNFASARSIYGSATVSKFSPSPGNASPSGPYSRLPERTSASEESSCAICCTFLAWILSNGTPPV
jgi:hypothetical protein